MDSTASRPVELEIDHGVATLAFNRPQAMNTLDVPTATAFRDACRTLAHDSQVRAVVLKGNGKAFSAGGDLISLQHDPASTAGKLIEAMHEGVQILTSMNAPVIASLHGVVAGGSLSLALACDLAIAAEGTRFNLAYANLAANCDVGGSWSLPRIVGLRKAMEIALLSETFDVQQALQLGLVNRVVPADALADETQALARRLANGPTLAYGKMKRLLRQSLDNDFATQLDAERDGFVASTKTADFKEAVTAFLGKRPAKFIGG